MLAGYDGATARGLNALDVVVGQSNSSKNSGDHRALVWANENVHDINMLLIEPDRLLVERAFSVNGAGQIVADGESPFSSVASFLLTPVNSSAADLNGDCSVGGSDLQLLFTNWGTFGPLGDLDESGFVDIRDLLFLLANWD